MERKENYRSHVIDVRTDDPAEGELFRSIVVVEHHFGDGLDVSGPFILPQQFTEQPAALEAGLAYGKAFVDERAI